MRLYYGGEKFVAALPQINAEDALTVAEPLRQLLAAHPIKLESAKVPVTASFGVAKLMAGATDLFLMLNRADEVYYAKQTGGTKS